LTPRWQPGASARLCKPSPFVPPCPRHPPVQPSPPHQVASRALAVPAPPQSQPVVVSAAFRVTTAGRTLLAPVFGSSREPTANPRVLETSLYVSGLTGPSGAKPDPVGLCTFAACAELRSIMRNPVRQYEVFPIVTPLLWERWQDALRGAGVLSKFADVPRGLCFGFKIGVSAALTSTFTPPNNPSGMDNYSIIESYYMKEMDAGRVSAPYDRMQLQSLVGFFRTAPLGVIFRSHSAKPRIIQDPETILWLGRLILK